MNYLSWSPVEAEPIKELEETFRRLDSLKEPLRSSQPLSPDQISKLKEHQLLDMTYNSNAIEGNSLSLSETQVILQYGVTISGKSLAEHIEVVNHKNAYELMQKKVEEYEGGGFVFSLGDMARIHSLILAGNIQAGQYRHDQAAITDSFHRPPRPEKLPRLMMAFMDWYEGPGQNFHPVERAARVHADLVTIHPFIDGNGRTARLLMTMELIGAGFPPACIKADDKTRYVDTLQILQTTGDCRPFVQFIAQNVEKAFDLYWHLLDIDPKKSDLRH